MPVHDEEDAQAPCPTCEAEPHELHFLDYADSGNPRYLCTSCAATCEVTEEGTAIPQ